MGRTKGALNKQTKLPDVLLLSDTERLEILASLLLDIITEELCTEL